MTANAIVKSGGSAALTCKITGADLTQFLHWTPGHDTALNKDEKLSVVTTYDKTTGMSNVVEQPS